MVSLKKQIRESDRYTEWAQDVLQRDGHECTMCGGRAELLNAHHIKAFSQIMDEHGITTVEEAVACPELWDIRNGMTVCIPCHNKIHAKLKAKAKVKVRQQHREVEQKE